MTVLTPRPLPWRFGLEKWYLDVLTDDGTVLLIYLARMRIAGFTWRRFTAELFPPRGPATRASAIPDVVTGGGDRLQFGPATIEGPVVSWSTPSLSGRVSFRPRHGPVRLRDPFLTQGSRHLDWQVEIPDADVAGWIGTDAGESSLAGRGYRDRVFFDLSPWRFPIRELEWGRATAGPLASTWVRARTDDDVVEAGWRDGHITSFQDAYIEPRGDRVLVESSVIDLDSLHLGWARPILRRLSGDPHEIKYANSVVAAEASGRGVHERVRWR